MSKKIAGWIGLSLVMVGLALLAGSAGAWRDQSVAAAGGDAPQALRPATEAMPLSFIENRGQADPRARYILRGSGQTLYLTDTGLLFDFLRLEGKASPRPKELPTQRKGRRLVVGLDLVGANAHPQLAASDPKAARFNYLIGNDRSKWVTDVPAYGEVLYRDVYPAVDMRVYDERGTVRYDFIVRPGGRVADIRLAVSGADKLRLDKGRMVADTAFGELVQSKPVVFQESPGGREPVAGRFAFAGGDEYGFAVGAYDASRPLVIDPAVLTLGYSTFLGGSGNDVANDVKWDGEYYYVTGSTTSADFPTTTGAYDTTVSGTDAYVAKINPGASGAASLVWCTFIGGSGHDFARGIDVYGNEAYIAGLTYSSDFPLANQGIYSFNNGADIFVTRLNSGGTGLVTSVCLGRPDVGSFSFYEWANDISVFMPHAVWICGFSDYGPDLYPGAMSRIEHGTMTSPTTSGDAFMIQVNMDATPASLGTVMTFGGTRYDEAFSIAQDGSRIYLTGYTESSNYPVSTGAFQSSNQGGKDAFVFKTDFGGSLTYSTYLGGHNDDMGTGIDIGAGGAYVCGYTYGDFPMTANGYDTIKTHAIGKTSGFFTRVNESGGSLDYSTYLETVDSGQLTYAYGIATSGPSGYDCWVTGSTTSYMQGTLIPPTKNYYRPYQGGDDPFAARFDTAASGTDSCLFITTLGGSGIPNEEKGLAIDGYKGTAVVAGSTMCSDFPISASAYDSSLNGGSDAFVTTLVEPVLAITTNAATNVYSSSATLNSTLTSKSGAATVSLRFEYGTTSGGPYTLTSSDTVSSGVPYAHNRVLTGLTPGTTYYFRARVDNTLYDSPAYGAELSFTTATAAGPTVTTTAASSVTASSASSGGNVTAMGSDPVTARGACWNTAGTPTTANSHTSDGSGTGSFTSSLTGLNSGTTYHVRAYATNAAGTAYGNEVTFTTLQAPTVTTQAVTAITATTATGNGSITSLGVPNPTAHGVCWNTTGSPTTANSYTNNGAASSTGAFTSAMTGLSAYTTYYVRAYATNSAGTSYGSQVTFTTSGIAPTVTTQAVTAITATTATGNGNITSLGVPNPTAHGVCWNTTGTPATADSHTDNGAASSTGAFTSAITGLSAYTTYYVRAYATNSAGTSYGSQVTFTTSGIAPTVTTQAVTAITATTATGNGNITSLGVPNPTAHGVCWNTTGTPATADSHTDNGAAAATGAFSSGISGLTAGTTYYVRAYATNIAGTTYGSEVSFISLPPAPVATAATAVTASGFTANWNAASGATGYRLDVSTSNTFASYIAGYQDLNVSNVTSYAVSGLSGGVTYYYRVRATNGSGTSADSNVITVATVPPAPMATAATAVTASGFTANWNAAASASGYRLDVATDSGFASFVIGYNDLDVGNATFYSVSGLSTGTTYYYRVRATNASGTSANSNWIEVITVPGVPVATAATAITASGFTANFNAVTGASDYYLDVATDSAFTSFVPGFQNLDIGLTSYPVPGLTAGTSYYYRVRAYNGSGTSGYSNTISVLTLPDSPVATAATSRTGSSFQANWNAVVSATGYRIDVAIDAAFTAILPAYNDLDAGNLLNLAVSGLAPNTPYYYRVRATNASGSGADSNVIGVTTLQVYTVTFTGTAGGWLSGALTQIIDHGGAGSPVAANPDDGYHFDGWRGTGGFVAGDNPLTVTNVLADMTINASFANAAPLVRIVEPLQGQNVWGTVTIRAEASDDMAVQSIQFYVDGVAPMASPGQPAQVSRQAERARQLQSGELVLDFEAADILLLDSQNHLRQATFQGNQQPVINGDFALRELAVSGRNRVHLLFVEPRRLDDGQTYSWVLCDLDTGTIQGIRGDPARPVNTANTPIMQFDAAGNGYYFTADGQGSMFLVRQLMGPVIELAAGTTTALYSVAGQQLRDWLVLPDGTVLLAIFQPQTAQLAYFKIGAEQGRVFRFEGGFAAALPGGGQVAGTPWFKVQGDQLLASSGATLAMSAWPVLHWENHVLPAVEIVDMAMERGGTLFVSGRDPLGATAGLWAVKATGSELVAPLPLPCRRVAVLTALDETVAPGSQMPAALTASAAVANACDWNTLLYVNGEHRVSVVASDAAGATARDEIVVRVANVVLSLSAQRFVDHGWLIKKNYIRVRLSVDNSGGAPVARYLVYRRINHGSEEIVKEFQPAEAQNGVCEFNEAAASGNPSTSYRAVALSADGMIIGAAAAVTI